VPSPLTDTPVPAKLGFDPRTMPMKPLSVEQCVSEGLNALRKNRSRIVPGRMNRIMNALLPASVKRTFTVKMLGKSLRNRAAEMSVHADANQAKPLVWSEAMQLRIVHRHCRAIKPIG